MADHLVKRTLDVLRATLPGLPLQLGNGEAGVSLVLPTAPEADYRFLLWFYSDGNREIGAELVVDGSIRHDLAFWYRPFELAEFDGSATELATAFNEELALLLGVTTRIRQRRGWLFWTFVLEHCTAGG